jgi:hypothetical protein
MTVPATSGLLTNDVGTSGIVTFQNPSALGGTVAITDLAGGSFTYEPPPPSAAGVPFTGLDTFTYTAQAPDGRTAQGTVTVTIGQVAWYVMNDFAPAVGQTPNGTSTSPFTTLAATAAVSRPGDIIFVHTGNGTNTGQSAGVTLLANQKLLGQGVGLTFDVLPNDPNNPLLPVSGVASTAANPAAMPIISDNVTIINNSPIVRLASGAEVAGIIVDGSGAVAGVTLHGISGGVGVTVTGFSIHNNTIRNVPRAALLFEGASGGVGTIAANTIDTVGNLDNAVDIVTTAAGANFTITENIVRNALNTGIRIQFTGAGGGTVAVTNNTLTNIGTVAGRRGIDVDAAGAAPVTTTISGNIVDNSALGVAQIARSGIQVNASTASHAVRITGNTVLNANPAPADGGIQAQITAPIAPALPSSLCLQMTGNNTGSGFVLDNRPLGTFQIEGANAAGLQAANNNIAFTFLNNVNDFTFVPAGTCGFGP